MKDQSFEKSPFGFSVEDVEEYATIRYSGDIQDEYDNPGEIEPIMTLKAQRFAVCEATATVEVIPGHEVSIIDLRVVGDGVLIAIDSRELPDGEYHVVEAGAFLTSEQLQELLEAVK